MSPVKNSIKNAIGRFGYAIHRLPPPRDDPRYALTLGFDAVVAHYLATRTDPRPFFFLQVGANDGIRNDPLHPYVLKESWKGILLEPQPEAFDRLTTNYAGVEGLMLVNAAISEQAGSRSLYVIRDSDGAPDPIGGASSFRRESLEALQSKPGFHDITIGSIEVRCTTFVDVLAEVAYLDLLQVDVEGFDLEILRLFDFDAMTPPIVHFEHKHLSADELDEAFLLLAHRGYRMTREEHDTTAYRPIAST